MKTRFYTVLILLILITNNAAAQGLPDPCACSEDEINMCSGSAGLCPLLNNTPEGDPCCQFDPNYVDIPLNRKTSWLISGGIALGLVYIFKKQKTKR